MKKTAALLSVILLCNFCSLFKARIIPYPTGVMFPVTKDHELTYEGEIISPIQKKDHLLYFSTRKGRVYCMDGQKREMVWQFDIPNPLTYPPHIAENRIYVYDGKNILYSLNLEGKLVWETELADRLTSGISASGTQVFIGSEKGLLYSLSAENGKEIWQFQAGGAIHSNIVIWRDTVLFGCEDHHVYFVDKNGRIRGKHDTGGNTGGTLTVDEDLLFFGTEDKSLHCVNLNRIKTKWKIRSGGATFVPPIVAGNRVFFLCWNCVLYSINKKNGTILWWNSVPSRSFYRVIVIEDKVVVSSFSSKLVCFDAETGEDKGTFGADGEIKSNPAWMAPFLTINLHDRDSDTGKLVFLKKVVKVVLASSEKSPHKPNEEITFTARDTGFHLPKYEFFLTRYAAARFFPDIFVLYKKGDRTVVQETSDSSTWNWFPEEEGYYNVEVVVEDEREKIQAEMPFLIQKEDITVALTSSKESPQGVGQEIVFTASYTGFVAPQVEFHLKRLKWVSVLASFFLVFGEDQEVSQDMPGGNSWTWRPEAEGWYVIRVVVQEGQDEATAFRVFNIIKE